MNKKEKIKLITDLIKHYQSVESNINALCNFVGGDYDSPLPNSVFKAMDSYIDLVETSCGWDKESAWISWFIFENRCGKNKFTCKHKDGKPKKICSVKDLVEFLDNI